MAHITLIFLTLVLVFSLSLLPHNANTTSFEFSTTILNVTAILPFKPKPHQPSSSSSLPLHPIDSGNSLLARLGRDSARVTYILSKLDNNNNRNLKPNNLSSPVTSGVSAGNGEYFVRIGVGQPSQQFYMVIDTGSDLTWLQCEPCLPCYKQTDPIFDPATSSSYSVIPCDAKSCTLLDKPLCSNRNCHYVLVYGDQSYSTGNLVTEMVSLGQTGSTNRIAMGCGHMNQGLFVGAAGILGLGGGPLSFTSQINATSFSYCLVDRGTNKTSSLEFNSARPADSVTTRLVKNLKAGSLYYAAFSGVSVGGLKVRVPESTFKIDESGRGGTIIDSGTVITRLQREAYVAVRDAFVAKTTHLRRAPGFLILDTCYDLSSERSVRVPKVSFEMSDGKSWVIPPRGYMIPVDAKGTFCFAFAPLPMPLSIIGNVLQQETHVTFDLANSVIGFSPSKC
ncbi:hypothetical protein RJT34_04748 [Clitoria ternatea]|uniref:Peptidase A1 domain-containing protein n=1 Tax=Clitoria ternatea TaxID=43366 RepID=A0AAN9KQB3_CLITE